MNHRAARLADVCETAVLAHRIQPDWPRGVRRKEVIIHGVDEDGHVAKAGQRIEHAPRDRAPLDEVSRRMDSVGGSIVA